MKIHLVLAEDYSSMKQAVKDAQEYLSVFGITITTERKDVNVKDSHLYETAYSWSFLSLRLTRSLKPAYVLGLASAKYAGADCIGVLVDKKKADEHASLWGQQQSIGNKQTIEVYCQNNKDRKYGFPVDSYVLIHEIFHALADHHNVSDGLHLYQDNEKNKNHDAYRTALLELVLAKHGDKGLLPLVAQGAQKLVDYAGSIGLPIRIVEGHRSPERQTELYNQRPKVTNAKAWESMHQYRVAFDIVFRELGYNATAEQWRKVASFAKSLGFEWGGDWKGFVDKPHFELTFGKKLKDFQKGKINWSLYWGRFPTFTRDLYLGTDGEDVRELQRFLNKVGYKVALFGSGSPGNESTYFGEKTQAALIKFQKEHGVHPTAGFFGPITRDVLRERYQIT